jgi:hypothetical protein
MVYVSKPSVELVVLVLGIFVDVDHLYVEYGIQDLLDFEACQVWIDHWDAKAESRNKVGLKRVLG